MTGTGNHPLQGRWRIVEADIWDRAFLDLVEPAHIVFAANGRGEFALAAVQGGMESEYAPATIFFTWEGFDEMGEANGSGSAELLDDGTLKIELSFHLGDEAVLKATRQ